MMRVLAGNFGVLFLDGGILRSNLGKWGDFWWKTLWGWVGCWGSLKPLQNLKHNKK